MSLDILPKESIFKHGFQDLANLKQRELMTYELISTIAASTLDDLIMFSRNLIPSSLDIAHARREQREVEEIALAKHQAGKKIAHEAVAYLFGAAENHEQEFAVGSEYPCQAQTAQELHEGYAAHLDYLCAQGALTFLEDEELFIAYGTGRLLHRVVEDYDADGHPGVIVYRDSETQRQLEITSNDPRRLVAEA